MTTPSKRQAEARERAIALLKATTPIAHGDAVAIIDAILDAATPEPGDYAAGVSDLLSQLQPGERDPRD